MRRLAIALACAPLAAQADTAADNFVESNLLSIFYHELGHALIDVMALPVFGQEEDAADTASILLIDASFDNGRATDIAYDAALGFSAEAQASGTDIAWSDVHGADQQRFFNLVCLFYGADPAARDDFAADMDLPQERAETCAEEFALADESWGPVFDTLLDAGAGDSLTFISNSDTLTTRIIQTEVAALNAELSLPAPVSVRVESCNEPNAFYDPEARNIIICTEFDAHLRSILQKTD